MSSGNTLKVLMLWLLMNNLDPSPSLALQTLWHWQSSAVLPDYTQVMAAPIVVPLGLHGTQLAVVFNSWYAGGGYNNYGVLRAVNAATGSEIWTVTTHWTAPCAGIAAADIDDDGLVEIIAPGAPASNYGVMVFEHDGTFKWQSTVGSSAATARTITIADLNGDGQPEILCGKTVMDSSGGLVWEGSAPNGYVQATVADLDSDGQPEVLEGYTVYRNDGSIWWQGAPTMLGSTTVADFDGNSTPEVLLTYNGELYLYTNTGTLIWGPITHPDGGNGSPCIADFNGDGAPDIALAGKYLVAVYLGDGSMLWQQPFNDSSSGRNGCTACDLNGDSCYELLAQDQEFLRIYNGPNGAVIHELQNSSGTIIEYPVSTDLDADNAVEIVLVANNYAFGTIKGVRALQPDVGEWSLGHSIWNQYGYHTTNVAASGGIPSHEVPPWLSGNTLRARERLIPTPTRSPTTSPTLTPTPSPTVSPTLTPTWTPSLTQTCSPTQAITPTPTLTPEPQPIPALGTGFGFLGIAILAVLLFYNRPRSDSGAKSIRH